MSSSLYYKDCGSGQVLVLLHGNGEDHSIFAEQIAFFATRFRVIAIDSVGHGQSPALVGKLSYEKLADEIENLLAELKIEKYRIIGFSDGGIIALLLALRNPKKIAQMILIGANYRPAGMKWHIRLVIFWYYLVGGLRYFLSGFSKSRKWQQQLLQLMLFQPNIRESELQKISVDTLLAVGDNDMIRLSHTKKLASLLSNCKINVLKNCSHFVLQQQPEEFNRLANDFLQTS